MSRPVKHVHVGAYLLLLLGSDVVLFCFIKREAEEDPLERKSKSLQSAEEIGYGRLGIGGGGVWSREFPSSPNKGSPRSDDRALSRKQKKNLVKAAVDERER